jgi:quercetin dioxygenase-like cupin family protein
LELTMTRGSFVLAALAFAAGLYCHSWIGAAATAQTRGGKLTELKRVDLEGWCNGKEATVSIEEIAPQHQSKHYHPAYSFAYMLEGSQTRTIEGQPPQTFHVGDVTQEDPMQVSESDILAPTKVLLFRIREKGKPASTNVQ